MYYLRVHVCYHGYSLACIYYGYCIYMFKHYSSVNHNYYQIHVHVHVGGNTIIIDYVWTILYCTNLYLHFIHVHVHHVYAYLGTASNHGNIQAKQ